MLTLESLTKQILECEKYVKLGKEDPSVLDSLLSLKKDLEKATANDWEAYNELVNHLPDESVDPVLIILKGHLLIERLVRKFVFSRLPNPEAFLKNQFSAAQCITVAESLCLKNDEPEWLWKQIREINKIRNKLAHSLDYESIEPQINSFVSTVVNFQKMENRTVTSVVARLYGMLKGLCDLACSEEFKIA